MTFTTPPGTAAWRHLDARDGFEVAYFQPADDGLRVEGCTTAVEEGETWIVGYAIELDASWTTRSADHGAFGLGVTAHRAGGRRRGPLARRRHPGPHLDGCLDVDLESSAMTNAFPVHRMGLRVGDRSPAPAAYVRATDLAVERLEQDYVRIADEGSRQRYDYSALVFDFACRLVYDESGLVLDYPEIAVRAA